MEKSLSKVEVAANVAIVVVAVLIGFVVLKYYIFAPVNRVAAIKQVAAGEHLNLPGIDWAKNRQTLVVVMAKGCHFCAESAPFYQRLANLENETGEFRLIAVLPEEIAESRDYLSGLGLKIDTVEKASLDSIEVVGTPTLILVNGSGIVSKVWVGKLSVDKETEVTTALQPVKAGA